MGLQENLGGIPTVITGTATTTAQAFSVGPYPTKHIVIKNTGTEAISVYFSEKDVDKGNGFTIPNGDNYTNPLSIPAELRENNENPNLRNSVWVKASSSSATFEIIALLRRG